MGSGASVGTAITPAPHLAKWQDLVPGPQDSAVTLLSTAVCPQLLSREVALKHVHKI